MTAALPEQEARPRTLKEAAEPTGRVLRAQERPRGMLSSPKVWGLAAAMTWELPDPHHWQSVGQ